MLGKWELVGVGGEWGSNTACCVLKTQTGLLHQDPKCRVWQGVYFGASYPLISCSLLFSFISKIDSTRIICASCTFIRMLTVYKARERYRIARHGPRS